MTTCDNSRCEHNNGGICKLANKSIVDCMCVSRRKKQQEEDYAKLMRVDKPNCHSSGGKYKSDRVILVK